MHQKLKLILSSLKIAFLEERGTDGGTNGEYREYVTAWARENVQTVTDLAIDSLMAAADATWRDHRNRPSLTGEYQTRLLDGDPREEEITFQVRQNDEDEDDSEDDLRSSRYRTVLYKFATVGQFRRYCMECQRNAVAVQTAAQVKWERYNDAMSEAKGDESASMAEMEERLAAKRRKQQPGGGADDRPTA